MVAADYTAARLRTVRARPASIRQVNHHPVRSLQNRGTKSDPPAQLKNHAGLVRMNTNPGANDCRLRSVFGRSRLSSRRHPLQSPWRRQRYHKSRDEADHGQHRHQAAQHSSPHVQSLTNSGRPTHSHTTPSNSRASAWDSTGSRGALRRCSISCRPVSRMTPKRPHQKLRLVKPGKSPCFVKVGWITVLSPDVPIV